MSVWLFNKRVWAAFRSGSSAKTLIITTRVQITAWGQSPKAALELAHEVLKGFAGYRGTVGGVTIQGVFHAGGPGLLYDPADVVKTYYCPHDFYFHYALPA